MNTSPPITKTCAVYNAQYMVRFVSGYYLSSDSDGYPEVVYFDRLTFIHAGLTVSETYEDDRDRYTNPLQWNPSAGGYRYSVGDVMYQNLNDGITDYQICREQN